MSKKATTDGVLRTMCDEGVVSSKSGAVDEVGERGGKAVAILQNGQSSSIVDILSRILGFWF
jgi:hypothetical protein